MASQVEVAWAAGLFEGEGSCGIGSGQRQPRLQLVMTDRDVVDRFAEVIGVGNVRTYHRPPNKRYWQWSVQSQSDVLHVLNLLWPYLGQRRLQAATEVIERAIRMNDSAGFCRQGHDLNLAGNSYLHRKTGKRHCIPCRSRRVRERRRFLRLAD